VTVFKGSDFLPIFADGMDNILITGATGFIGGFIVDEALRRGMDVWVAVRKNSSRKYLTDTRIHFIELDLTSADVMIRQIGTLRFDYVVHAAGVTKSLDKDEFYRINTDGTRNLVQAIQQAGISPKKFVYLSSLSVYGPVHEEQPHKEITDSDIPCPNTDYGRSKLEAERYLKPLNYIILRPTGVYGPREKDYFMMARSISRHVDFAVGYKPQDITFVYVLDVVQAVFLALDSHVSGRGYFLSDGNVYRSRTFSDLIRRELGCPWWIRITAPIWLLRVITLIGECAGRVTGRVTALNNDKFNIMRQRNWRCDIRPAERDLGYKPRYQLEEGVRLTIKWYRENGWL